MANPVKDGSDDNSGTNTTDLTVTVIADSNTEIEKNDAHTTLDSFTVGEEAEAHYRKSDNGNIATKIEGK